MSVAAGSLITQQLFKFNLHIYGLFKNTTRCRRMKLEDEEIILFLTIDFGTASSKDNSQRLMREMSQEMRGVWMHFEAAVRM